MEHIQTNRRRAPSARSAAVPAGRDPVMPGNQALEELAKSRGGQEHARPVDLPGAIRAKMEHAFGADLSSVKLYESQSVADAGAQAVTQGSRITFAPGRLDLSSTSGQALLGHELSHVVSQARGQVSGSGFLDSPAMEARADREGAMAAAGQSVAAGPGLSAAAVSAAAGPMQAKKDLKTLKNRFSGGWDLIKSGASKAWDKTKAFGSAVKDGVSGAWQMTKQGASELVENTKQSVAGDLLNIGTRALTKLAGTKLGQHVMERGIEGTLADAPGWIKSRPRAIGGWISGKASAAGKWIADSKFGQGVAKAGRAVASGAKWLGGKVADGARWVANSKFGQAVGKGARAAASGVKWLGGKAADGARWVANSKFGQAVGKGARAVASGVRWLGGKAVEGARWLGGKIKGAVVDKAAHFQRGMHRQADSYLKDQAEGGAHNLEQMDNWTRLKYTVTNLPGIIDAQTTAGRAASAQREQRAQLRQNLVEQLRQRREEAGLQTFSDSAVGPAEYEESDLVTSLTGLVKDHTVVGDAIGLVQGSQKAEEARKRRNAAQEEQAGFEKELEAQRDGNAVSDATPYNDTMRKVIEQTIAANQVQRKSGVHQAVTSAGKLAAWGGKKALKYAPGGKAMAFIPKTGIKLGMSLANLGIDKAADPSAARKEANDSFNETMLGALDDENMFVLKELGIRTAEDWNRLSDLEKNEIMHELKWVRNEAAAGPGATTRKETAVRSEDLMMSQIEEAARGSASARERFERMGYQFGENGMLDKESAHARISADATGNGFEDDRKTLARHREEKHDPLLAAFRQMEADQAAAANPDPDKPGALKRMWNVLKRRKSA